MPNQFGHYELARELGRGGQAVVFEAVDTELGRTVALKVLLPGARSAEGIRRFLREAQAAARLNHPNVISIFEVGEWQDRHYLAMQLVRGESLDEVLAEERFGVREAMEIVEKVAGALQCAHDAGIVHRDIKPGNILLEDDGTPKLTDFGLALDTEAHTQLTQSGTIMGTAAYMPPEQARGKSHRVDGRSDVYSLGAVLYEMLTGRPAFRAETQLMLLQQITFDEPRRPSEIVRSLPPDAETIVLKCLEKVPARRYQSAGALAADIRRFLAHEPIAARPASLFYRARKGLARHKALAAGISAVVAALVVGLSVALYQWRQAEAALVEARNERSRALAAEERATAEEARTRQALAAAESESRRALAAKARAEAAEARLKWAVEKVETVLADKGEAEEAVTKLRQALGKERMAAATVRAQAREEKREKGDAKTKPLDEAAKKRLAELLDQFDALVLKGEYVKARAHVEAAAGDRSLRAAADRLWAAARVARALEDRRNMIRHAVEGQIGRECEFETTDGRKKGKVERVTREGIDLSVELKQGRRVLGTSRVRVAWKDLAEKEMEKLAARWNPQAADGGVARAYLALARGDLDGAEMALRPARRHPVTKHLRDKIDDERLAAEEAAARAAWGGIEAWAEAKEIPAAEAEGLLERISAFERKHVGTQVAASVRRRLARTKKRAEMAVRMVADTFGFRTGGGRMRAALRGGGSKRSESTVESALRWLARHQTEQGNWEVQRWGGTRGEDGTVGVTGLGLLAFLGAGHTEKTGEHRRTVQKAVSYLISQQAGSGAIGRNTDITHGGGYTHGIAGLALAEAYGMAGLDRTRVAAQKGVDYSINEHQNPMGGWRYVPRMEADTSITSWFVAQLKSAIVAGLKVDPKGFQGAVAFLDKVTEMPGGGVQYPGRTKYQPDKNYTATMTSVGMLCRQFMGWKRQDPLLVGAANYLMQHLPEWGSGGTPFYYWYYGTLVMFQMGGDWWKTWNASIRDMLISHQHNKPHDLELDGSWDPLGWDGKAAGRAYSTAMGCLTLEVYYRYLIYK